MQTVNNHILHMGEDRFARILSLRNRNGVLGHNQVYAFRERKEDLGEGCFIDNQGEKYLFRLS